MSGQYKPLARDIVAQHLADAAGHEKGGSVYYAYLAQADEIIADLKRAGFILEQKA